MTLLLIFIGILLFLWGLVEASKAQDIEEHNRIMEEKDLFSDNRVLNVTIEGGKEIPTPLKRINR